jgi:hypothetical protein
MDPATPHFVPVVLLCTLHLAGGFAVGLFIADTYGGKASKPERTAKLKESLRLYRDGFKQVSRRARKLTSMTEARGQQIPESLTAAI